MTKSLFEKKRILQLCQNSSKTKKYGKATIDAIYEKHKLYTMRF